MPEHNDHYKPNSVKDASRNISLAQIVRVGILALGFGITIVGIILVITLFYAVFNIVFADASGLKAIFETWRDIIVPEGIDPGHYDHSFPITTLLTFLSMSFPVLFLAWLATSILKIGVTIARFKDELGKS